MSTRMKTVVPLVLSLGVSSTAYAEMESIADGELSEVTGQSGLTIDYSGRVTMQEFRYENDGEYVAEDIRSGGAGLTDAGLAAGYGENFDDARLTFDVASDGGLDVVWQPQGSLPIDWGLDVGAVSFGDGSTSRTEVFNGLQAWGLLQTAQHSVLPASLSGIGRDVSYNYLAFTVENLKATKNQGTIGIDGGYIKSPDFTGNSVDDMDLTDQIPSWAGAQRARSTTPMDDIRAGFAASEYTVYSLAAGEQGAVSDTLAIEVSGFAADIGAQNISVGTADMGRMALDNLQISDTIVTLKP